MYNIIMYLIQAGVAIASLFNEKVRKMWKGERECFKILEQQVDPSAKYAWFHAASLGEFEQGRPIMERMRREYPEYKILLTFYSPSGYEVRKNYEGADIICYMPIDTVGNARRFLRLVRPSLAFFIKYEFWYNFLHILKHRNVPTYSVSSIFRPNQVFFRWYGRNYGHVLRCFTKFFVQNETSMRLLANIGITDAEVTGDTRFDRVLQIKDAAKQLPVVERFVGSSSKVFIVGSSWEPDEDIYLPYFKDKDWKIIVATHVVNDTRIAKLRQRFEEQGKKALLYSEAQQQSTDSKPQNADAQQQNADADVLIINCYGLLSSIYRYGNVAYVGGGFGVGIHNLPEAAVWDVPVFFGPNNQRFQEAQDLKENGGGIEIHGYEDFAARMDDLMAHPEEIVRRGKIAGDYVNGRAGATEKILQSVVFPG
ncbi:MAG: 3-deoxy-D-manno-octulosonic acid transferase [Prevotella sp.]|nr:3-deoxy-D-manno-octulosonic acid transferase [Prevotella sp.]